MADNVEMRSEDEDQLLQTATEEFTSNPGPQIRRMTRRE